MAQEESKFAAAHCDSIGIFYGNDTYSPSENTIFKQTFAATGKAGAIKVDQEVTETLTTGATVPLTSEVAALKSSGAVTVLSSGKVVVSGEAAQVRQNDRVREVYLGCERQRTEDHRAAHPVRALRRAEGDDLTVREGEVVGLLGPNGAGKTTTLRAIMGLMRRRRGSIRIAGQESIGWPAHQAGRGHATLVPERARLQPQRR